MTDIKQYDVELSDLGSIILLCPLTAKGREWIDSNLQAEAWQWHSGALAIDPRMIPAIVDGMIDDDLDVSAPK